MNIQAANFWAKVQECRKQNRYTWRDIAEPLGLKESVIKSSISQNLTPSVFLAYNLARSMNTTVEYLITGKKYDVSLSAKAIDMAKMYDNLSEEQKEYVEKTLLFLTNQNK